MRTLLLLLALSVLGIREVRITDDTGRTTYVSLSNKHVISRCSEVRTCSLEKVTPRRTAASYNRPHMTTRSANAFRFFAFLRTGAGCLIA